MPNDIRFFRMSPLSQLAILLAEPILKNIADSEKSKTALLAWNSTSSFVADKRHQVNIKNNHEQPGNFVYTLPNIALGEMAIRHKISGENNFFITPEFDVERILLQTKMLLNEDVKNVVLCWIEAAEKPHGALVLANQPALQKNTLHDELTQIKSIL